MPPYLTRIRLYPVKSLDPIEVSEAVVLRTGGLAHDREYCLRNDQGLTLTSKNSGSNLAIVRSEFNLGLGTLSLRVGSKKALFHLPKDKCQLEQWFTEHLEQPVNLFYKAYGGFPDDEEASGPTLVSRATLEEVATWFTDVTTEEIRRRFRSNIEIDGVPAFWEDHLFEAGGGKVSFKIGDITIEGIKPCARCVVPQKDSFSGKTRHNSFVKTFSTRRARALPVWADRNCFDHFYYLATNSVIPSSEAGKLLQVGDIVVLQP